MINYKTNGNIFKYVLTSKWKSFAVISVLFVSFFAGNLITAPVLADNGNSVNASVNAGASVNASNNGIGANANANANTNTETHDKQAARQTLRQTLQQDQLTYKQAVQQ